MKTWDPVTDALSVETIVDRAFAIPPFVLFTVTLTGEVVPWRTIYPKQIVSELVVNPHRLRDQIDALAVQIGSWGRLCAQARRVWAVREREYRVWRSRAEIKIRDGAEGKAPSKDTIDAMVRLLDEYAGFQTRIEEAEEAYNAATAIYEAFRAKQRVLGGDVYRTQDGEIGRRSP